MKNRTIKKENIKNQNLNLSKAQINYLYITAKDYLKGARNLKKLMDSSSELSYSCCFLISTSLELFIKTYIAIDAFKKEKQKVDSEELIYKAIVERLKKYRHDIKECIENEAIEIKKDLSIKEIKKIHDEFTCEYEVILKDDKKLFFKDMEAIRYGSFAKRQNTMMSPYNYSDEIFKFLDRLSCFITKQKEKL